MLLKELGKLGQLDVLVISGDLTWQGKPAGYTELAKWAARRGFDELRVDGETVGTARWPRLDRFLEHDIELPLGSVHVRPREETSLKKLLAEGLEFGKGVVQILPAGRGARAALYSVRRSCPGCG